MATHRIAVVGGDGIGPEVTREAMKVLNAAAEVYDFNVEATEYPYGTEHYLKTGEKFPDRALEEMRQHDAIYLGAIGDPRVEVGMMERAIIAGIRFKLDLFVNLRPIKLYDERLCPLKGKGPDDVDFIVIRENTEDAYAGIGGILKQDTPQEVATQTMIYTRHGVERVIRYAFELAKKRNKKNRVTLVDKANAIRAQSIWTRTFAEVAKEYPEIETDHGYVDATCMWMLSKPEWYDVIVTPNLFGDIITDLGAAIQGGMGVAASGNIHPGRVSLFEPIHGSAPKYAGKNVASPVAAIAATAMMLSYLGETEAGAAIDGAIEKLLTSGKIENLKAGTHSTSDVGDWVVELVQAK